MPEKQRILVAIPCLNEAATVGKVVEDFRRVLPEAEVVVFDNASDDGTAELARAAGAEVRHVAQRGKGHVVSAIFEHAGDRVFVLVDGDDTYLAEDARTLVDLVLGDEADMAIGDRLSGQTEGAHRAHRRLGNHLIVALLNRLFHASFQDVLSGYRAIGPRVTERVALFGTGFEVETELTVRALAEGLRIVETPVGYRARPEESESKLRAWQDGYRILLAAIILLRDLFPLRFFGITSAALAALALAMGILRILAYLGTSTLPTSLLAGVFSLAAVLSLLSLGIGLILNAVDARAHELGDLLARRHES